MSGQNFYLSELNVDASSALATITGAQTISFSGDADATVDVSASVLQTLFQFESDSIDIDNVVASDIKYRVVQDVANPHLEIDLNTNTEVTLNYIHAAAADNHVAYDYVRYLAKELFNTHLGVDLFSNETELRNTLNTNFQTAFDAKLAELTALGWLDASSADANPSKKILDQILNNVSSRLGTNGANMNDYKLDAENNYFKMPILAGDALYFLLTVDTASGQGAEIEAGLDDPADRSYLIKINVV